MPDPNSAPTYCTLVFKITDQEKARALLSPLIQAFRDDLEAAPGVHVTAVSLRDEISIVEALEAVGPAADVVVTL